MLGSDISAIFEKSKNIHLFKSTIDNLDITDNVAVDNQISSIMPDIVIHTAAYTAVDLAEKEWDKCFAINVEGTKNLALACKKFNIEMIFTSTDYVFDGTKQEPYIETDKINPINNYGKSKAVAENIIISELQKYKIVRTSWLCGPVLKYSRNFIETILSKSKTVSELKVVNDQHGRPTFSFHLAQMLLKLIEKDNYGIFHITNSGECTWYEFAKAILSEQNINNVNIIPISSNEYPTLAKRPKFSVLENKHLRDIGLDLLPNWQEGLKEYFMRREVK